MVVRGLNEVRKVFRELERLGKLKRPPRCPRCGARSWLVTSKGFMCSVCKLVLSDNEYQKLPRGD